MKAENWLTIYSRSARESKDDSQRLTTDLGDGRHKDPRLSEERFRRVSACDTRSKHKHPNHMQTLIFPLVYRRHSSTSLVPGVSSIVWGFQALVIPTRRYAACNKRPPPVRYTADRKRPSKLHISMSINIGIAYLLICHKNVSYISEHNDKFSLCIYVLFHDQYVKRARSVKRFSSQA